MRYVTAQSKTTLSDLTRRLFEIQGPQAAERAKQAEAALEQANPHLRDLTQVPAGTLILVPDVPGVSSTAPQAAPLISPQLATLLTQALAEAKAVLEQSLASQTQEVENTVALTKKRELKEAVKQAVDLNKRLAQITNQAKARIKEVQTIKKAQIQGLAQLRQDLDELIKSG